MHRIQSVVEKFRHVAIDRFLLSSPKPIVIERRAYSWPADTGQLISCVPGVGRRSARIRTGEKISVVVIGQRFVIERRLVIGRVVSRGRDRLGTPPCGRTIRPSWSGSRSYRIRRSDLPTASSRFVCM